MWPRTFAERLASWSHLRLQAQAGSAAQALTEINRWWFQCPWQPYHLHWDDRAEWPDPWQLLSDNMYCDIARGLGILYTITLVDHPDIQQARLVHDSRGNNLVLIEDEKYILNWDLDSVVNISPAGDICHQLSQTQLKQQYT
jgi:hypothetical protein